MSTTDDDPLREIFLTVSEDGTVTERQAEEHSREPIDEDAMDVEREVLAGAEDGLDDAVAGAEGSGT